MKHCIFVNCLIAVFVLTVTAGHIHAASLTDAEIKNFISSMQDVQAFDDEYEDIDDFEGHEDEMLAGDDMTVQEEPLLKSIQRMKGHDIYNKLEDVVRKHGFSDLEQWAQVGDRVMKAFIGIHIGDQQPNMQAEMEASIREIDENPHMTEEQKDEMKQMMRNAMSSMEKMTDAPSEDMDALRSHIDELNQVLDYEE